MSELRIRVRTLVGFIPVGIERLWRTAVGPPDSWTWLASAIPWVLGSAMAIGIAALSILTLRVAADAPPFSAVWGAGLGALLAAIGQPLLARLVALVVVRAMLLALAGILGGALGAFLSTEIVGVGIVASVGAGLATGGLLVATRRISAGTPRDQRAGLRPVPLLVSLLLVLSVLPLIEAGAEIIVTRTNVADFVDRRVGFSSTLVEVSGYALVIPLEAEAPSSRSAARDDHGWLLLRDGPKARKVALVRTTIPSWQLGDRSVLARVAHDPTAVEEAAAGMALRGIEPPSAHRAIVLQELTIEAAESVRGVRSVGRVADLESAAAGTIVRIPLHFSGLGVAACVADGSCNARRLAGGVGPWEQYATDGDDAGIVVQTPYPPSLAPVHVVGRQLRAATTVERFIALPWVASLLDWAQVLHAAIIEQDPSLPVDHLWLGPILFALLATLLLVAARIGYPIFRPLEALQAPTAAGSARTGAPTGTVAAVASGRISPPGRRPLELDGTAIDIRLEEEQPVLTLPSPLGTPMTIRLPRGFGALSGVEVGELWLVSGRRPAIRASWYGSQVLLEFASDADRAVAIEILRRFHDAAEPAG